MIYIYYRKIEKVEKYYKFDFIIKSKQMYSSKNTSFLKMSFLDEMVYYPSVLSNHLKRMPIEQVKCIIKEIQASRGGISSIYLLHRLRVRLGLEELVVKDKPEDPYMVTRESEFDLFMWEWDFVEYILTCSLQDLEILKTFLVEDLKKSCCDDIPK